MAQMGDGMKNGMTLAISLQGGPLRSPGSNDWLDTGSNGYIYKGKKLINNALLITLEFGIDD